MVSGSQRIGSYAYDANGNMRQRVVVSGTKTITYEQTFDVENRLVSVAVTTTDSATTTMSVSRVQYVYDGSGARVLEIGPEGLSTAYVGELYEVELGASDPVRPLACRLR